MLTFSYYFKNTFYAMQISILRKGNKNVQDILSFFDDENVITRLYQSIYLVNGNIELIRRHRGIWLLTNFCLYITFRKQAFAIWEYLQTYIYIYGCSTDHTNLKTVTLSSVIFLSRPEIH